MKNKTRRHAHLNECRKMLIYITNGFRRIFIFLPLPHIVEEGNRSSLITSMVRHAVIVFVETLSRHRQNDAFQFMGPTQDYTL